MLLPPVYISAVPSPDDIIRAETLRHAEGIDDLEVDAEVVYDENGLGVSQCRIVNDFAVPETVPLVVAPCALRQLQGRTNVYITPYFESHYKDLQTRLLKAS